jgi:hypothetical protein
MMNTFWFRRLPGAGAITRTWHFEYLNRDGDKEKMGIKVHEPTFIENDLGFKTWGSAPLLARYVLHSTILISAQTGMYRLTCADWFGLK